jgi:hypothetical protein
LGQISENSVGRPAPVTPKAPIGILERRSQNTDHMFFDQGFQPKQVAPAQQGRVDVEAGIVGGRSNQPDISFLDIRKEQILLRLVEAVDLVDEEDGPKLGPLPSQAEDGS